MRAILKRARGRIRDPQSGFTLVEMLIAAAIMSVVMGAVLALLSATWSNQPADQEWNHQVEDTRTGVYRMTRELRQGTAISLISGYRISADVRLNGVVQHVLYQCDVAGTCTRKASAAGVPATGPGGEVVARNVLNAANGVPVFTQPSTGFFKVLVQVAATGSYQTPASHTLTYTDGVYARNN
jgi:prepilin-type N-terminal cleavage/methylation domain-containing protein